jgi:hypothetical protein
MHVPTYRIAYEYFLLSFLLLGLFLSSFLLLPTPFVLLEESNLLAKVVRILVRDGAIRCRVLRTCTEKVGCCFESGSTRSQWHMRHVSHRSKLAQTQAERFIGPLETPGCWGQRGPGTRRYHVPIVCGD